MKRCSTVVTVTKRSLAASGDGWFWFCWPWWARSSLAAACEEWRCVSAAKWLQLVPGERLLPPSHYINKCLRRKEAPEGKQRVHSAGKSSINKATRKMLLYLPVERKKRLAGRYLCFWGWKCQHVSIIMEIYVKDEK